MEPQRGIILMRTPTHPRSPSFSNGPDDVGRWQRATFKFLFFFFRGPLLDWFGQIMLYSHWSTQTWRSTNACVPATDEAVVCTLIEPSNAGAY